MSTLVSLDSLLSTSKHPRSILQFPLDWTVNFHRRKSHELWQP